MHRSIPLVITILFVIHGCVGSHKRMQPGNVTSGNSNVSTKDQINETDATLGIPEASQTVVDADMNMSNGFAPAEKSADSALHSGDANVSDVYADTEEMIETHEDSGCENKPCQAIQMCPIDSPVSIALDHTSVYVTTQSYTDTDDVGWINLSESLLKINKGDNSKTTLLWGDCSYEMLPPPPVSGIGFSGPILGQQSCSGNIEQMGDLLEMDKNNLYWYNSMTSTVFKMPTSGSDPVALAQIPEDDSISMMATNETSIYWIQSSPNSQFRGAPIYSIMKVDKSGGDPVAVVSEPFHPHKFAVDNVSIYWINDTDMAIMRLDEPDGTPRILASPTDYQPYGSRRLYIALDSTQIYLVGWGSDTILKLNKAGGEPILLAASSSIISAFTIDDQHVYWAKQPDSPVSLEDRLWKIDKNGGTETELATAGQIVGNIAVDEDYLYWITNESLMKISK